MFNKMMCYFKGHNFSQVEEYTVELGKKITAHVTIKECARCGHKTRHVTFFGTLSRDEAKAVIDGVDLTVSTLPKEEMPEALTPKKSRKTGSTKEVESLEIK